MASPRWLMIIYRCYLKVSICIFSTEKPWAYWSENYKAIYFNWIEIDKLYNLEYFTSDNARSYIQKKYSSATASNRKLCIKCGKLETTTVFL